MNERLKNVPWQEAALPAFATLSILAILFRLPTPLADFLLSVNFAVSATIFLAVFFVRKPLDFSAFPTVLLVSTLYRLVLNVSTTRLILTQANAGEVVDAFSRFVAGDNIVVGAAIFLIFIILQFVVITKGATRISEVAARFALDALPGRQAAIDFDLNAGNITSEEARAARAELSESADFFGAMDGAGKFVRGDAIAGLAIVAMNLLGGVAVGVLQQGMSASDALATYGKLTIGDGLVSQMPAFLISVATGLLVARVSTPHNISQTVARQTFGRPVVLVGVAVFLAALSTTSLPVAPLLTLSCACFALAFFSSRAEKTRDDEKNANSDATRGGATAKNRAANDEEELEEWLRVDPVEIALGAELTALASARDEPSLLDRVRNVRRALANELGVPLPKTRVRDDESLDERRFSIRINGEEARSGVLYPGLFLAVATEFSVGEPRGLRAVAPGGARAFWIEPESVGAAEEDGYEIWSAADALEKSLLETAREYAPALLSRDATKRLVERLRANAPALVQEALRPRESDRDDDVDPEKLARIQTVLQLLLRENVPIRRLDVVLEAINDLAFREPLANDFRRLEYVRTRLAQSIARPFLDDDGRLRVVMFDPEWEDVLRAARVERADGTPELALSARDADALVAATTAARARAVESKRPFALLVDRALRFPLSDFLRSRAVAATTLAFDEIAASTPICQEETISRS